MKKIWQRNGDKLLIVAYCFLIALVVLLFTSKCSILYPFNDWVDANAFFTVGKGMMRGVVPYLDVFEQKGPFLYLIYGVGSLISYKSFLGVFVLEVLSATIGLYFFYLIAKMFLKKETALFLVPLTITILATSTAFVHGGSCEEFAFPLFMITFYYFFKHFKEQKLSKKEMFINGLVAGLILLMKYTLLGFWIMFTFSIFVDYLMSKEYKKAICYPLILLLGMILVCVPFLIYFGINGALKSFFDNYFIINMTSYGEKVNIVSKIILIIKGVFTNLIENPLIFGLLIVIFIGVKKLQLPTKAKILLLLNVLVTTFFVYFGLKFYPYYLLFVAFFSVVALIILGSFINNNVSTKWLIGMVFLSLVWADNMANYKEMRGIDKNDLFQYQFLDYLKEDATLVNMGRLDCGLYTTSGILPSTYYFEVQNISYENFPDNLDAMQEYIKNKTTKYIIYYTKMKEEELLKKEKMLYNNYELVAHATQEFEHKKFQAYLFKERSES